MPRCLDVSTPIPDDPASKSEQPHATLGDVLYRNSRAEAPQESAWVELLRSVSAGDEQALRTLYERTHRLVFTLAVRITRDRAMSEELTIDIFHDVWRRASAFDPKGGTVLGWILNQTRSRAIDRLRFEHRQKRVNPYPDTTSASSADEPQELVESYRNADIVRRALGQLSLKEREAIERAFMHEQSYSQVAAELSEPVGTIKTRIRSGLLKLRHALAPEGEKP